MAKYRRHMQFPQDFWQNKQGNANSNPHTQLQTYILSNIFVIGKIRIMEFHRPPPLPTTSTIPPTHITPQIPMHICEMMRYRVSVDYS